MNSKTPKTKPIRERDIENYLVKRVNEIGGFTRKLKWIGHRGAPDRIVFYLGVYFVELKAPGKKPDAQQIEEHRRMDEHEQHVLLLDSMEAVDEFIAIIA